MKSTIFFLFVSLLFPLTGNADEPDRSDRLPKGAYIELTEDFYRALKNEPAGGGRVYGNSKSEEYLRQMTISTQFMVETNLQIIKQQEKIIGLLESMAENRKKK